ncbi:MAG: hypothetical protein K2O67_02770 [Clostridia bacterium]|nr:hypothetical protein [Clostridia bacterium]
MQLIDWIAIGVILVTVLLGSLLGFGKILKFFTSGIFGIIISVVVTYFCIGIVASWGFVQELMAKLLVAMQNANNGFVNFLINIGIERIILGVALFIIIQLLRIIIVRIIKGVFEINNVVFKVINRALGVILLAGIVCMIGLITFHIVDLIGGTTAENFRQSLTGVFKLEWVFDNNPLKYIIERNIPVT